MSTTIMPWHARPTGGRATQYTRAEVARSVRLLLESEDYQTTLKERIKAKDLPPAVETMLWYYAYGKPIEQVRITVEEEEVDLSALSPDELIERLRHVQDQLVEAQNIEEAIPGEYKHG